MICDYRERELLTCLTKLQVETTEQSLPVGDIWIGIEEKQVKEEKEQKQGLVIERKRIQDFEASFLDGRYREQRGRILSFCQEHQAHPLYLLEGSFDSLTGRITKKAFMKLINRLTLKYHIPIIHTYSVEESAEWLQATMEQWREDPTALQRTQEQVKVTDGIHIQKKQNAADPKTFAISCLAQCPGVSVHMATSLLETHGTFQAILALTQKELQEHKVGSRKIGPAVSTRLWGLLH